MSDAATSFGAEFSEDDAATLASHSANSASGSPSSAQQQLMRNLLGQQGGGSKPTSTGQNFAGNTAPKNEQLHQARKLLSPIELIRTASEQFFGETSPEEQQRQQAEIARDRQRMADERQRLETFRQKQQMARQQQGQTNAALADQATPFMKAAPMHIGSSKTEQALYEDIIKSGQQHQASQRSGATLPQSSPKGPNMGNAKPKADMMARMQPDSQKPKKSDQPPTNCL
ncbi:hypothetical protein LRY60_01545 [Candidatus Woesebacteria bacterium]|nr:hypothetical protein [Candidatus Woesebacteria bacterium]